MILNITDKEKTEWLLANGYNMTIIGGKTYFFKDDVKYTIDAAMTNLIRYIFDTRRIIGLKGDPGESDLILEDSVLTYNSGLLTKIEYADGQKTL